MQVLWKNGYRKELRIGKKISQEKKKGSEESWNLNINRQKGTMD
jgi:hypothetical protein